MQRQGEGKESSTSQVLGMEELFYIATQEAEDNQGTGTTLVGDWSRVNLNTWSTQMNRE